MTHKDEKNILTEFQAVTKATPVPVTDDDTQQMAELIEKRRIAQEDYKRTAIMNEKIEREKTLREMSRAGASTARAAAV